MIPVQCPECQVVRNSKQARVNDRRNRGHVCSECQSGSKQARVNARLSLSPCGVCGGVCGCGCGRGVCVCGVVWHVQNAPRLYIQNVPAVCTGTTRTCRNTCARGARIHGDVLNVHTGTFWSDTRSFFSVSHHTPHRTKTTTQDATHKTQHDNAQLDNAPQQHTETETERQRKWTEKEREE